MHSKSPQALELMCHAFLAGRSAAVWRVQRSVIDISINLQERPANVTGIDPTQIVRHAANRN